MKDFISKFLEVDSENILSATLDMVTCKEDVESKEGVSLERFFFEIFEKKGINPFWLLSFGRDWEIFKDFWVEVENPILLYRSFSEEQRNRIHALAIPYVEQDIYDLPSLKILYTNFVRNHNYLRDVHLEHLVIHSPWSTYAEMYFQAIPSLKSLSFWSSVKFRYVSIHRGQAYDRSLYPSNPSLRYIRELGYPQRCLKHSTSGWEKWGEVRNIPVLHPFMVGEES